MGQEPPRCVEMGSLTSTIAGTFQRKASEITSRRMVHFCVSQVNGVGVQLDHEEEM